MNSTDGNVRVLSYQYREDGARTRITLPDGNWFNTSYDPAGRPYYLDLQGVVGIAYAEYLPSGLPSAVHRVGAATAYDAVQRPAARAHYFAGGTGNVLWTHGYNPASGIAATTRDNEAYAWQGHYAVERAYATNGLNQYSQAVSSLGTANYGYDANGNLISDGSRTFSYDVENRLVSASPGVTLSYDPLGRLSQVTGTSGTTQFLYDGDALVAEYNGTTLLRRHVHWPGADVPMATYEYGSGAAVMRQLFADRKGSIVAVADGAGNLLGANSYDEYGIPAATNVGRFQYTGQLWLAELGMYHYKGRIYSPTLGRFPQTDPVGYEDQFNLYAYVGNDPINGTDPTGTSCEVTTGSRICNRSAAEQDHTFRNTLSAVGAILGGVGGGGVGGAGGAAGGAVLCGAGGPVASAACGATGGVAGALGGRAAGAAAGAAIGAIVGDAIDQGIALMTGRDRDAPPPTQHGEERRQQARSGDMHRQVGDPNRVVREGRTFRDTETGLTVRVNGDRAVVVNDQGRHVTQFRITRQSLQNRIRNQRWTPID